MSKPAKYVIEVVVRKEGWESVRRVRDVVAFGPSHVRVKVTDALTEAGFEVVRINWAVPDTETVPPRKSAPPRQHSFTRRLREWEELHTGKKSG